MKRTHLTRVIGLLFAVFALIALFWLTPLHRLTEIDTVIAVVEAARASRWTFLAFYLAFALGVLALPITMFPIVGGVLFPYWVALPMNVAAATFGSWIAFLLARFAGRETVERWLKGRFKSFDSAATKKGLRTVFLLRWVGVPPFLVANYALGLSGIRSRDFLIGTAVGILPWMAIVTMVADSLWSAVLTGGEEGLMKAMFVTLGPLMALSVMILISVGVTLLVRRRRSGRAGKAIDETEEEAAL